LLLTGTYDTGFGSLASHAYEYKSEVFTVHPADHQQDNSSYVDEILLLSPAQRTSAVQYYTIDQYVDESTHPTKFIEQPHDSIHLQTTPLKSQETVYLSTKKAIPLPTTTTIHSFHRDSNNDQVEFILI
jgi:hypothetical protein